MGTDKVNWLAVLALALTAVLVYSPHFNYIYPLHSDEWHHIAEAKKILEGRYGKKSLLAFEPGYHVFLAAIAFLNLNLITAYRFLPPLFALAACSVLYLFVKRLSASSVAALFSIVFYASLPTNTNVLGVQYAVPLTFAVPFMYLCMFFFYKGFHGDRKSMNRFLITFSTLLIVHPPSALFTFAVAVLYGLASYASGERQTTAWKQVAAVAVVLFAMAFIVIYLLGDFKWFLSKVVFNRGWTPLEPSITQSPYVITLGSMDLAINRFHPALLFGLTPFLLSLLGMYYASRAGGMRVFQVWVLFSASLVFLFNIVDFIPIVPYQRAVYYMLVGLVPLAGIGLERLVRFLDWSMLRTTAFVLFVVFVTFHGYGGQPPGMETYYLIDDEDYAAGTFLSTQSYGVILAPLPISSALPALTSKDVVADMVFAGSDWMRADVRRFFAGNCDARAEVIRKHAVRYIYSPNPLKCKSFKEIYSRGRYIYQVW